MLILKLGICNAEKRRVCASAFVLTLTITAHVLNALIRPLGVEDPCMVAIGHVLLAPANRVTTPSFCFPYLNS